MPEWSARTAEGRHDHAQQSTGLRPQKPEEEVDLPEELRLFYERCLPLYERLREHRLRV